MDAISFQNLTYSSNAQSFSIPNWQLEPNQHWVVFATSGHCGQALIELFDGEPSWHVLEPKSEVTDYRKSLPQKVAAVSLRMQQDLLELEIADDDTDFLDRIDYGHSVEALVLEACSKPAELEDLLTLTDLQGLRHRGFRQLSTGETRRVMLARALATQPDFLILDEPYAGLDVAHQAQLSDLLTKLSESIQLLVITSRESEVADCITHIAFFDPINRPHQDSNQRCFELSQGMPIRQWLEHPVLKQLSGLSDLRSQEVIELIEQSEHQAKYPNPVVELHQARVEYSDGLIFEGVNWRINHGEHWQVRGPNGCGKSTLLGLILGDHPQCYSNDIDIFGKKRGSGESIWQIKQEIGIVSSSLHLQYRVNCSALDVVLSGLFDSIGLYQKPTLKQIQMANQWLKILHLDSFAKAGFKSLDYGQQRLLLIARALIKKPVLLILDEPYQGLDFLNRRLVLQALNMIAQKNLSQLLYVAHHVEDSLSAINNFVDFVPHQDGYQVQVTREN